MPGSVEQMIAKYVPIGAGKSYGYGLMVDALEKTYANYQLSPNALSHYTGTYVSQEDTSMSVALEEGQLVVTVTPSEVKAPLHPIGPDQFIVAKKGALSPVEFIRNASGKVCRIYFGVRQVDIQVRMCETK